MPASSDTILLRGKAYGIKRQDAVCVFGGAEDK
jgi:hypothetical protein